MTSNFVPTPCFADPIAFSETEAVCAVCAHREACQPAATARLAALREKYESHAPKKTVRKPSTPRVIEKPVPPAVASAVAEAVTEPPAAPATIKIEVPKKVGVLIDTIRNRGINVAQMLLSRKNPFPAKPVFLHVTCKLLIENGSLDRTTLRTCLMGSLNWSYGTANAHVGQVFSLLPALDAATEVNGRLQLRG